MKAVRTSFVNALNVLESLGDAMPNDDTPIQQVFPKGWPTVGDLKKLVREANLERED